MQKLISILIVIVNVLPLAMGYNFLLWKIDDEYATNIKISESDPNKYNRVVPVVVFPGETVKMTLSCVNVYFDGEKDANAKWDVGVLENNILNDDKVEITTETDGSKTARWLREILITEKDKGVEIVSCEYSNGETEYPKINVQLQVYVKEDEDDTTWIFGQGISEEPKAEVAENINAQLEKRYGEGKVSQQSGNKFTVPAPPSPTPTPPDDGLSGGVIAGIVVGCLAFLAGIGAAIRAVLTGNCGWFSQKYSDYVQASPGDEESFWGCFAKNSDSGSEVKMDNLMKTDK